MYDHIRLITVQVSYGATLPQHKIWGFMPSHQILWSMIATWGERYNKVTATHCIQYLDHSMGQVNIISITPKSTTNSMPYKLCRWKVSLNNPRTIKSTRRNRFWHVLYL